jgi:hypothetical protein
MGEYHPARRWSPSRDQVTSFKPRSPTSAPAFKRPLVGFFEHFGPHGIGEFLD